MPIPRPPRRAALARIVGSLAGTGTVLAAVPAFAADSAANTTTRGNAKTVLRMASSWPTTLPLLHECALDFARTVQELSDGLLEIEVHDPSSHGKPAGVLDLVRSGGFDLGHTTAQYYAAALPAIDFFTAVPFGLMPLESHTWMAEGEGLTLMNRILAPHGVQALVAGDTGTQMGGWFTREINTVADMRALRIRIAGFPGRVLGRMGALPTALPLGQIAAAFEARSIDAADIVGPAVDQAVGVAKHARYYYAPWHELNVALHLFMNTRRIAALPSAWRHALRHAAQACSLRSLARAQHRNATAMRELVGQGVQLRRFPDALTTALKEATRAELESAAAADALSADVIRSWRAAVDAQRTYSSAVDMVALTTR